MKSIRIGKMQFKFVSSLDQYEGSVRLSARKLPVYITADADSHEELCNLAESTLANLDKLQKRVLKTVRSKSVEDEYLTATAAKKLSIHDLKPTAIHFLDDGEGPYIDVSLDLQCWFTEPDDGRMARYIEDPDDGDTDIEVYVF